MNMDKALKIFGLPRNYTDEQLKKSYRRLISQYHPDKFEIESKETRKQAEEKAKEINIAKEYLEKNNKSNINLSNNQTKDIIFSKQILYDAINKMLKEINELKYKNDPILLKLIRKILKIIEDINKKINPATTLSEIRELTQNYYKQINTELNNFYLEYCKKHNIDNNNLEDGNYSLKELYYKLENLKRKKEIRILNQALENLLYKYSNYNGYNIIEKKLLEKKSSIIFKYQNNPSNQIVLKTIIEEFTNFTDEEFKNYYIRVKILFELKEKYQNIPSKQKLLKKLEDAIAESYIFSIIVKELEKEPESSIKGYSIKRQDNKIKDYIYINDNYTIKKDYIKKKDYKYNKIK